MIIQGDSISELASYDTRDKVVVLDPPFNIWGKVPKITYKTLIAFTNFQNREKITNTYGTPKVEIIWHIPEGRWVSNNFPQLNHENILIYGQLGSSYVGEYNQDRRPIAKGNGNIGSDNDLGKRTYRPRERKMLNSVLSYPRNMNNEMGCWGKPVELMVKLLDWLCDPDDHVFDPFFGSGTTGVACVRLNLPFTGIEIDEHAISKAKARIAIADLTSLQLFPERPSVQATETNTSSQVSIFED